MNTLHYSSRTCTAQDALAALDGTHTLFVSTPTQHVVATATAGRLTIPGVPGWPLPASCFQLVAFTREMELRWLADHHQGRAVWRAEQPELLPHPATGTTRFDDRLVQRAVLWGEPAGAGPDGFSTWTSARIGTATYPCPPGAGPHHRAVLDYAEYVTVDQHGNAAVADHRLLAISTVDLTVR
jgi:CRISPR-associated protein (TIGR03984 family)